ncbi:hypothetical protein ATCC90586_006569 [Pythium insidiosum]|nr:hypothetical protein ATCC90586_006569 [Pythium insidiosum]
MIDAVSEDDVPLHMIWIVAMMVLIGWMTRNLVTSRRYKACVAEPLLEGLELTNHRIDAARREAEHGFLLCAACGFENFTRVHNCALCGALCFDMGPDEAYFAPQSERRLTPLQRRARMRKEWQRKVDIQGRIFWYRNSIDGVMATSPGYVIQFSRSDEEEHREDEDVDSPIPSSPKGCDEVSRNASAPDNDEQVSTSDEPDIQINRSLDLTKATFKLTEASQADGAAFPHDALHFADRAALKQGMELAARDFPSKFSHFVVHTALLANTSDMRMIRVTTHRDYVLEQSMTTLSCIPDSDVHLGFRVVFKGESGIDAGGLHREWIMLLNEMLTKPEVGLFKCTNRSDQTFYINANSAVDNGEDHLVFFFGAGRMVGRALLDGAVLGFHLSVPLLKMILGMPVTFDDLEYYDADLYRNLKWLLENEGVESLGLDFSVCEQRGFRSAVGDEVCHDRDSSADVVVVDLIPNGRDVTVTDENKALYVDRRFKYVIFESVWEQLNVFLRGIYDVIPARLLLGFDYEELDYLLCGTGEIDVNDWEQNTRISLSLEDNPRVLEWFWQLFKQVIPNGDRVPGIQALGHTNTIGGGLLNDFGQAFRAAGFKWTKKLCQQDSDGDGQKNGEELGDPCCVWKVGDLPTFSIGPVKSIIKMSKSLQRVLFHVALFIAVFAVFAAAFQQSAGSKGSGTGEEYEAGANPEDEYPAFVTQNKSKSTAATSAPVPTPTSAAVTAQLLSAVASMAIALVASMFA